MWPEANAERAAPSPDGERGAGRPSAWPIGPMAWGLLALLVGLKLLLHLLTSGAYGYFRDELYFLDCARHLGWGYVDDAPMIALVGRVGLLLGGSLPAIRLLPALAGAAKVALTMAIAREFGGGRFAQGLAGLCVLAAPIYLAIDGLMTPNAFEPVFWMGCVLVLSRIVRTGNSRLWLWFGALAGLGLENKYTMLAFGFAAAVALLLTPQRRELARPWLWLGGLLALALFLPTLLWQASRGFPLVVDMENIRRIGKNVVLAPAGFVGAQIALLGPLAAPVWLGGLWSLMAGRLSRLRVLGWTFLVFFACMMAVQAKSYYLAPIYPMLFAAGATALEGRLAGWRWSRGRLWPKASVAAILALATAPLLPLLLPLLPPAKLLAYQRWLGRKPPQLEVQHEGPFEQRIGDQFGWVRLSVQVARIYDSLPPKERAQTAIFANNYGEAGAINLFGPALGLPAAICAHQAESLLGPPAFEPTTYICLGCDRKSLEQWFDSVSVAAVHYDRWGMAEENHPIYLCRGPRGTLAEAWPALTHWD